MRKSGMLGNVKVKKFIKSVLLFFISSSVLYVLVNFDEIDMALTKALHENIRVLHKGSTSFTRNTPVIVNHNGNLVNSIHR